MMEKTELTLYLGGTRSGKSARAEAQALRTAAPCSTSPRPKPDPTIRLCMKGSGGTGTAARRTGAHWSALCILRSGSPLCSRPFFSKPLPPFLRSNLQNPAWAALPRMPGKPPRKGRQSDRLRNAVGVEHTVRPAGTGGSDGLRNRRTHGSKRAARPDGTLKLPMDSGIRRNRARRHRLRPDQP